MGRLSLIAAAAAALALAACRPEEQGRQIGFTPGVYGGPAMPKVSPEQVKALQERGLLLK